MSGIESMILSHLKVLTSKVKDSVSKSRSKVTGDCDENSAGSIDNIDTLNSGGVDSNKAALSDWSNLRSIDSGRSVGGSKSKRSRSLSQVDKSNNRIESSSSTEVLTEDQDGNVGRCRRNDDISIENSRESNKLTSIRKRVTHGVEDIDSSGCRIDRNVSRDRVSRELLKS